MDAKYLRDYNPEIVCGGCEHRGKESCVEGFYGIRIEFRGSDPYARLCIQKTNNQTVMTLEEFRNRDLIGQL